MLPPLMLPAFANPLGFLALLGLPAVLAIHFLQQKAKLTTVSTLFLLEQVSREDITGHRFERFRRSIPLWLQLLGVLLLTWLLVQPRWVGKDSVQRVAIVLDSTASMQAFRPELSEKLPAALENLAPLSARSEYTVLESHSTGARIFTGSKLEDLKKALAGWRPLQPAHDPADALRLARSLVGPSGLVALVTDHEVAPLPFDARLFAIGEKKPNVGFTGVQIESGEDGRLLWKVLLRNYSDEPVTVEWRVVIDGTEGKANEVALGARKSEILQGPFLSDIEKLTLKLDDDAFTMDNVLPILRPQPKALSLTTSGPVDDFAPLFERIASGLPHTTLLEGDAGTADAALVVHDPLQPAENTIHACLFASDPIDAGGYLSGDIVTENHPLMRKLNWQGLLARKSLGMALRDTDEVLLWIGGQPMIFLRSENGNRQLGFAFDVRKSNATRLPAFIVLLHRFFEGIRGEQVREAWANVDTLQRIDLAVSTGESAAPLSFRVEGKPAVTGPLAQVSLLRAPSEPRFFEIWQGEDRLLRAAAQFSDVREADFQEAAEFDGLRGLKTELVESHSESDGLWRLWILLLAAALLGSWYFSDRRRKPDHESARPPQALREEASEV